MEHLDNRTKIAIMTAIMAAMLFAALNQTIVGTALPRIIADLGGMEYFSWVFTVFMLASTITAVLAGKLSDIYGRKPFILTGLIVFMGGTFLCGLSQTIVQLILYRGIQGLGAGIIMSTSFTAVADLFPPRERGRWQGLMGGVFGLSSVLGPTLGGYIVDHTDWHWVFWVFLPLGFAALALIWFLLPAVPRREGEKVDYAGSVLLAATTVPLLLAFSWAGQRYEWGSSVIVGLFIAASAGFVLFIIAERKATSPVLPLHLFKSSIFTLSNLIGFVLGAGMFGAIMYMPFFVQGVLGTSATLSGYVMMPMMLSLVLASILSGNLMTRTGKYKGMLLAGLLIMAAGMVLLTTMDTSTSTPIVVAYVIVVGFGLGAAMPVINLTVQNAVEDRHLGVATASSQLFRQLGGTIGVSLLGTVMLHRISVRMGELAPGAMQGEGAAIPSEAGEKLAAMFDPQVLMDPEALQDIQASLPESLHVLFGQLLSALRESLGYGLSGVFMAGALMIAGALALAFFLKEIPLRSSAKARGRDNPESHEQSETIPRLAANPKQR